MLAARCGSISITANEAVRQLVYIHTVDMASSSLLPADVDILGFGSCSDIKCLSAKSCKNLGMSQVHLTKGRSVLIGPCT
jgi:hypothetical protein